MDTLHYQTQTLVEVAHKAIKSDITQRVFAPGQKIIIRELCDRYGISETPIKQALNRLISEGLVENIPRKGMKVRSIKWEEVEELLDIRLMIEKYYSKQALWNFHNSTEVRTKLFNNISEHKQMIENVADLNDYFRNYYLDQQFHQLYVMCSNNKRIIEIYSNLGTHAYSYYVYGRQEKEGMIKGVREHDAIYNALKAQDEAALLESIETHIVNAKNNIYAMLKAQNR